MSFLTPSSPYGEYENAEIIEKNTLIYNTTFLLFSQH